MPILFSFAINDYPGIIMISGVVLMIRKIYRLNGVTKNATYNSMLDLLQWMVVHANRFWTIKNNRMKRIILLTMFIAISAICFASDADTSAVNAYLSTTGMNIRFYDIGSNVTFRALMTNSSLINNAWMIVDFVGAGIGTRFSAIGSGTFPSTMGGTDAVGYFKNTTTNAYNTNYGIYAQASNSGTSGSAYAVYANGNIGTNGGVIAEKGLIIPSGEIYSMPNYNSTLPSGYHIYVGDLKTANRTYTLPSAANFSVGECIIIVNWNDYNADIIPGSGQTLNGYTSSQKTLVLDTASSVASFRSNGSNQWMIISAGNLPF